MIARYENVGLCQDERPVLTDINLEINEAEFIYILGEVGSGKTSLLKSLYGELGIAKGQATVLDFDMNRMKPRKLPKLRRQLGIVFQDFQLLRDRTVAANLNFVLRATGWSKKTDREARIIEVLEQVGLPDKTRHAPYELSGGEQQRVCIARALILQPELVVCDESVSALDVSVQAQVLNLLNDLKRQHHYTYLFITHDLSVVKFLSDRIMVMQQGRIVESGTADEVFSNPQTDYTRTLLEAIPRIK